MKPIPQPEAERLKRENRAMKARLKHLTQTAAIAIEGIDWLMTETPATPERGARVARLLNLLDLENDGAMHFSCKVPLDNLKSVHQKARRWAQANVDELKGRE